MHIKKNKNVTFGFGAFQMTILCRYLLVVLAAFAIPSLAAVNMTDVEFNSLPAGKVQMRFDFDAPPPEPKAYTIESPARIALDLNGVTSSLKQKKHTLDLGNTQSLVVVGSGDRTRVIINLLELAQYEAKVEGNSLVVVIGGGGGKDYIKASSSSQFDKSTHKKAISNIKSIDFRRGENNEGRVIVELTNPNINVDSRVEGKRIKLMFEQTSLPENLRLNYDVSDFATPVLKITANELEGAAFIDVEPTGEYEYLAYQADSTYVLTVKPLTKDEVAAKKSEFQFVGDRLSLNFQDIEVRAVLQLIADFTDLNLVASDAVSGTITLRLQNVPWDQALDLILKTKGLDKRQDGNVLLVAPAADIAKREAQELTTVKQLEDLAPLRTEYIRVKYAEAKDIEKILKSGGGKGRKGSAGLLSSRAAVVIDERTNSILITETASKLEDVRKLINLIDVPIRQVLIEARIVIASSEETGKLGIQWGANTTTFSGSGSNALITSPSGATTNAIAVGLGSGGSGSVVDTTSNFVDLGVNDVGSTHINFGFLSRSGNRFLDLELSAIESNGSGEVVAQPKIITGDKQEASIKSGVQVPYQEAAPSGGTTTAFIDAALELNVTPSITPDDRIIMDLNIQQDSLGSTNVNGAPTIDTTEIKTKVLVSNGETVVLGGIFQSTDLVSETKTPFLGDIPYIGRLFKRTSRVQDKTEILIFITPRILTDTLVQ
jgi:type IV pilus assembly protein PilQ